jgi:hypothetical protein
MLQYPVLFCSLDLKSHPMISLSEYDIDKDHWVDGFVTNVVEPDWSVWRQDENGNTFFVKGGLTESDALLLVREYEQKGHKQIYWAKKIK